MSSTNLNNVNFVELTSIYITLPSILYYFAKYIVLLWLWLILLYTFLLLLLNYFTANLFLYWTTLLCRKSVTETLYIDVSVCKVTVSCSHLQIILWKMQVSNLFKPIFMLFWNSSRASVLESSFQYSYVDVYCCKNQ